MSRILQYEGRFLSNEYLKNNCEIQGFLIRTCFKDTARIARIAANLSNSIKTGRENSSCNTISFSGIISAANKIENIMKDLLNQSLSQHPEYYTEIINIEWKISPNTVWNIYNDLITIDRMMETEKEVYNALVSNSDTLGIINMFKPWFEGFIHQIALSLPNEFIGHSVYLLNKTQGNYNDVITDWTDSYISWKKDKTIANPKEKLEPAY